ncbi:MAG: hypothetical protein QOE65_733 [Solirubrobacteraceae bacterium]|jgi:hypothetical protein|nr:hypothetical protein [Solirubrobacteraceae bacterium]
MTAGQGPRKDVHARNRSRRVGVVGLLLATVVPTFLFHRLVTDIASEFRLDFQYLVAEWSPWVLIGLGLAFAAPVVWSVGRDPHGRWYPRSRNAYAAWASVLYLLGMILAVQVAAVAGAL